MEREIDDLLCELNSDFSAYNIGRLMKYIGVLEEGDMPEYMPFNQYVFLKSKTDEIYGNSERQLIQQIEYVYLVTEFKKIMSNNNMPCQVIAVDMSGFGMDIYNIVLFMKIVIKSFNGWTLFLIRLSDGIHVGMKVFERDEVISCTVCEVKKTEDVLCDLMWTGEINDFIAYYSMLFEVISPQVSDINDFDENAYRQRGIQKEYVDSIEWISKFLKRDMTYELSRYEKLFEDEYVSSFRNELDDALEELADIKSSKVNTLEILFEAEETERNSTNQEYDYENEIEDNQNETDFTSLKLSGNDPEALIKLLKGKKGIII